MTKFTDLFKRKKPKPDLEVSGIFFEWAVTYFEKLSDKGYENLDRPIEITAAYHDFIQVPNMLRTSMHLFRKYVKTYSEWMGWEYNPADKCNESGRIVKVIDLRVSEMFYISTEKMTFYNKYSMGIKR